MLVEWNLGFLNVQFVALDVLVADGWGFSCMHLCCVLSFLAAAGFALLLASDCGKNLLVRQDDAAISSKMLNIEDLTETVADLDVEFDVWKVV